MSLLRLMTICAIAVGSAACSIRPLPEDFSGYDTVQIVSKVRCEVRDAIRNYILGALARRAEMFPQYTQLVAELESPNFNWATLRATLRRYNLDRDTFAVFERYNGGAIAYEFNLNIKEKNATNGGIDFLGTLTNGTISLGVNASSDLLRGNNRTFRAVDNFELLATQAPAGYCEPNVDFPIHAHRKERNFIYPMTGSLKLVELIGAFLNLNQSGNLVGLDPNGLDLIPTISDTIAFTTKLTAGATPSISLTPKTALNRLSLTKAGLTTINEREDFHQLRIIVKLPPEGPLVLQTIAQRRAAAAASGFVGGARAVGSISGKTAVARGIQALAVEELARQPDRELLEATIKFRERASGVFVD
jgi:hypothetical protein